jgi:cytochrome P450
MRPRLAQLVTDHLAQLPAGPVIDLVSTLAVPLPVLAIGEMLGLPPSDRHLLKGWSDMMAAFLGMRKPTPEFVARTIAAIQDLERYFRELLAQRRRRPPAQEDLLTALQSAEDNGALLSEQELLSTCSAVLFGGHETTTNLITNMVWLLTRFPEVQKELRRDSSAIPGVVEETLRFESPVQRMGRVANEDFELHGQRIQKGQVVWLVMGAANRDANQFSDPDSFLPRRTDNRHLAFGIGSHFCIGAALGRMEAQLAIDGLLRALPELKLAAEPLEWIDNLTVHGVKRLPLLRS